MPVTINGSNTPTAGGVTYGDGTQYATTSAGTSGQLLQSNGASAPSWVAAPTTSPAGSNTQIQYNNSGSFGASSTLTYDGNVITNTQANGTNSYIRTKSGTVDAYYGAATSGLGTIGVAGTFSNNDLALYANSAERFRIGTSGQLGIGGATYGTSGQVLTSGGSGAAPTWETPAGGFSNMVVYTSSTTWSVPAGITKCKVTVTGGGGGTSASGSNQPASAGAGGTAISYLTLSGGSATLTVGNGGSSGSTGGTSSFVYGATTLTGSGGAGIPNNNAAAGGAGGAASGGTINLYGGDGVSGGGGYYGGNGGASYWGGGGKGGGGANYITTSASCYGAGAGGAANSSGSGGSGVIVIEY